MGTTWSIRFAGPPGFDPAPLEAAIVAELATIIAEMSNWEATSAVGRFNAAPAGRWLPLPPALFHVVQAGLPLVPAPPAPPLANMGRAGGGARPRPPGGGV
ncbi:FAD:protein FMN transferase [Sphingomonas solaris]|uniref:FAD:protein FMN transferase n=2 Tax=Alterirhizorhabdus solaris TaxID=2529389 RepID=A0A558QT17_9SPHN|nr:FAD:protein FMN transferase [Sphingomonas solaris]